METRYYNSHAYVDITHLLDEEDKQLYEDYKKVTGKTYDPEKAWALLQQQTKKDLTLIDKAKKGDIEAKYWLIIDEIEIKEAFSYNFTPASKREIKKIIYHHFELIVSEWSKHFLNNGKDA